MSREHDNDERGSPDTAASEPLPALGEGVPFLTRTAFRRLYDEGRTDLEIAAVMGVNLTTVEIFRLALKLPEHTRLSTDRRVRSQRDGRDDAYQRFYDMGMIDAEIARQVSVTRAAVYSWRKGRKLPAHRRKPSTDDFWRYYTRGFTDREIATQTGAKEATIRHWRYRYDLPAVTRFHVERQPDGSVVVEGKRAPDYRQFYDLGYNDAEIASQVNRTRAAVQTWRRKNNLDANIGRTRPTPAQTHVPVELRAQQRIIMPVVTRAERPVRRKRTVPAVAAEEDDDRDRPPDRAEAD